MVPDHVAGADAGAVGRADSLARAARVALSHAGAVDGRPVAGAVARAPGRPVGEAVAAAGGLAAPDAGAVVAADERADARAVARALAGADVGPDLAAVPHADAAAVARAHGGAVGPPFLEAVLHPHARAYYRGADICTLTVADTYAIDGRTKQSPRAAPDGPTDGLPELGQLQ